MFLPLETGEVKILWVGNSMFLVKLWLSEKRKRHSHNKHTITKIRSYPIVGAVLCNAFRGAQRSFGSVLFSILSFARILLQAG